MANLLVWLIIGAGIDFTRLAQRKIRLHSLVIALVISAPLIALSVEPAHAGGVVGTGTSGSCTETTFDMALTGGGLVTFNCGPGPHTILLSFTKQIAENTEIRGGDLITLSGGNVTSHFQVFADKSLSLRHLTLSRGSGMYGAIENFGTLHLSDSQLTLNNATISGGAIQNYGVTILENSVIANNKAAQFGGGLYNDSGYATVTGSQIYSNTAQSEAGGGIWNSGTLTVTNTTLTDNNAAFQGGGGIYNTGTLSLVGVKFENNAVSNAGPASGGGLNHTTGTATLNQVTFSGNTSNTYGGGLYIEGGSLSATGALFTRNQAVVGGAVSNSGIFTLTNSLVYTNTASSVGGVANGLAGVTGAANRATLINVTVSDNASGGSSGSGVQSNNGSLALIHATIVGNQGGGVGRGGASSQLLHLKNTIVAHNTPQNCLNGVFSDGFNIASDLSCLLVQVSDRANTNPLLGPLANNGGLTLTYMPQAGSPAIDGGQCVAGLTTDQRGAARLVGAACDTGAVEFGAAAPNPLLSPVYLPLLIR